jgi:hypothetical protein
LKSGPIQTSSPIYSNNPLKSIAQKRFFFKTKIDQRGFLNRERRYDLCVCKRRVEWYKGRCKMKSTPPHMCHPERWKTHSSISPTAAYPFQKNFFFHHSMCPGYLFTNSPMYLIWRPLFSPPPRNIFLIFFFSFSTTNFHEF